MGTKFTEGGRHQPQNSVFFSQCEYSLKRRREGRRSGSRAAACRPLNSGENAETDVTLLWQNNIVTVQGIKRLMGKLVKRAEQVEWSEHSPSLRFSPVFCAWSCMCVSLARSRCPSCEISIKARSFKNCPLSTGCARWIGSHCDNGVSWHKGSYILLL